MQFLHKFFVMQDGSVVFNNPNPLTLEIAKRLGISFGIESCPPPAGFVPNLSKGRKELAVKAEDAMALLNRCELCGWRCGVNRFRKDGRCGLRDRAYHAAPYVHIGEEAVINPALSLHLYGCSWRCRYCQNPELLSIYNGVTYGKKLEAGLWDELAAAGRDIRPVTLEFVGGNPTESVASIMDFLRYAPSGFRLPVMWNDNMYGTPQAYGLLDGIVDVYMPDFRYGNDECARKLSGIPRYWETATSALEAIMKQDARVIVRILLLPGHVECCHRKALDYLSKFRDRIWISFLDQYIPEHEAVGDKELDRFPDESEADEVRGLIRKLGLREVNENPSGFWS